MKESIYFTEEDRQFLISLLRETKESFRDNFVKMSKDDSKKGERKFVSYWCMIAEIVFGNYKDSELDLEKPS